ncbi:MAG: DUF1616 domain-containing protein [Halobacteriota archaeon]
MESTRSGARSRASISDVDLLLALAVGIAVFVFATAPLLSNSVLRSVVVIPIVLFVPGYSFIAALFPRNGDITSVERAAFSFGLSTVIVPVLALALNYTDWGLSVQSVATSATLFILVVTASAYVRRHTLTPAQRMDVSSERVVDFMQALRAQRAGRVPRALTIFVAFSVLFSASVLLYSLATPEPRENYTEMYLLGPGGTMQGYPTNFSVGQTKPATVAIANHENRDENYLLVVSLTNGNTSTTLYSGRQTVANGQTVEKNLSLTPNRAGNNMRIDFLLYLDDLTGSPYRQLYLLVNVST